MGKADNHLILDSLQQPPDMFHSFCTGIGTDSKILQQPVFVPHGREGNIRAFRQSYKIQQLVSFQCAVSLCIVAILLFIIYDFNVEVAAYLCQVSLESPFSNFHVILLHVFKQDMFARIVIPQYSADYQIMSAYGVLCRHTISFSCLLLLRLLRFFQ